MNRASTRSCAFSRPHGSGQETLKLKNLLQMITHALCIAPLALFEGYTFHDPLWLLALLLLPLLIWVRGRRGHQY